DQVDQPVDGDSELVGPVRDGDEMVALRDHLRGQPGERQAEGSGDGPRAAEVGDQAEVAMPVCRRRPYAEGGGDVPGDHHALALSVLRGGRVIHLVAVVRVDRGSGVAGGPDMVAELQVLVDHEPAPAYGQAEVGDG